MKTINLKIGKEYYYVNINILNYKSDPAKKEGTFGNIISKVKYDGIKDTVFKRYIFSTVREYSFNGDVFSEDLENIFDTFEEAKDYAHNYALKFVEMELGKEQVEYVKNLKNI